MDIVDPYASIEYALQTAIWCTENNEVEALTTVLDTNFSRSYLSLFSKECSEILYTSLTCPSSAVLDTLLRHVPDSFLKQTVGNEKKTFLTKLLCRAVETNQADKISQLVKRGADVKFYYYGKPILHLALHLGHADVAKALVGVGACLGLVDWRENGPVNAAILSQAIKNKAEIVGWLIDKGADPMQKHSSGKLPLQLAARCHADIVEILIQAGCDVNITDDINGETALHHACYTCRKESIVRLIQSGAAFNLVNKNCETPLYKLLQIAINTLPAKSRIEIAKKLIDLGFRVVPYQSKYHHTNLKGKDKVRDLFKTLQQSCTDVPTLQNIVRAELRETLYTDSSNKTLDFLEIPRYLKSYLLCTDLIL